MKTSPSRRHASRPTQAGILTRAGLLLAAILLFPFLLSATPPAWWQQRGVFDASQQTDDFAAVNTGQLKHIAKQAMAELDARLPGRAGIAIHRMVDAWPAQTYDRDDFAAVNVGQVKALAKLFYDRLHQAGYLLPYPWNPSSSVQDDFAAANVGQVKAVFSFSVDGPIFEDADDDGLSDDWEFENFGSRSATNGAGDEDNDGVTNAVEFHYGTSPWSSDTDDDGLSDAAEIFTHHTDPTNGDTDADNLTDGSEVITYASLGLSPLNARSKAADVTDAAWLSVYDADGDGLPMLTEQSIPGLSDANPADAWGDMDHDGFSNLYEFRWGMNMQVAESSADGDGDGMSDVFEERFHQNKNNRYDAFLDSDGDGLLNYEEALHAMDPLNAHTRGGPQTDYQIVLAETAAANGTASEGGAAGAAESPGAATSGAGAGSAAIDDYDGDGLPNWWEILYGTNPRLADAGADPDDDGLLNRFEYQLLANPLDHDTDDDGTSDGEDPTPGSLIFPLGDKSYRLGVYVTDSYVAHLAARGILCDRFDVNTGGKGGMHFDASGLSELGVLPELTMGGHIKPWRDLIPYGNSNSLGAVNDLIGLGNARMTAAAQHYSMTAWSFAKDGTVGWTGFTIPNGPAYSACGNQVWGPSYDRSDLRYYYVSDEAAKEAGKVFLRKQTYRYDASKCWGDLTAQERQPVSDEVIAVTVGTSIWNPAVVSHEQTPFANDAAFQAARGKTTTIRVKPLQPDLDWVRPDASEVDEREEYSPGYVTINPPDLTALPALKIRASGDDAGTAWYKLQATYPALVTFDQPVDGIDAATDRLVHFTINAAPGALVPPFLAFKLLYSGDGTNYQEVDEVGMSLLPVEVRDGDRVLTSMPEQGSQTDKAYYQMALSDSNIAFIEPHGGTADGPRMPQLTARFPGAPESLTVSWKLEISYKRGNAWRSSSTLSEDTVEIPSGSAFSEPIPGNQGWHINDDPSWQSEEANGFFGGTAILYAKMASNGFQKTEMFRFRIGGKNPDPAKARTYIDSIFLSKSYAYAIAKEESKGYGGPSHVYYNQFFTSYRPAGSTQNDSDWRAWANGFPTFNDDDSGPGGYGVFQNTRTNIPRREIWNWQDNSVAGSNEINSKEGIATRYYTRIKAKSQHHLDKFNDYPPPDIPVGSHTFTSTDAIIIHAYNGMPPNVDTRYPFDPDAPRGLGSGKRWFWNPFFKYDEAPHYYIDRIEEELED